MPNAQALRLRQALEEFVRSYQGDTGSRRGGLRNQIAGPERELVEQCNTLLAAIDGRAGVGDANQRDTPGSRARDRATTGGRQMASSRDRARELLGAPSATNGPAGTPAGGGNNQGGAT